MRPAESSVVLFDGICNFCNGAVHFIIDRDPKRNFRFASLQSAAGQRLLARHHLDPENLSTLVLIENDHAFVRSTAALGIARKLRYPWPILCILIAVPRFIRDTGYSWFARNRYRWFGKTEACRLPTPDLRSRFLDDGAE